MRRTLHVEAPDLDVLAGRLEHGRITEPADLYGVVLCLAVGNGLVRGFGTSARAASRSPSAAASSSSAARSSALTGFSASSSSGVGFPLSFVLPRSSSTRD